MEILDRAARAAEAAGGGVIPSAEVAELERAFAANVDELMLSLIPLAQRFASPTLSGYQVGAVAEGTSGALYLGANLEFPFCPINQTVHAEQAAVANAASHGEAGLRRLAVSAAPCGHCRQFLYELSTAGELEILIAGGPARRLAEYLPDAFGPADLGQCAGMLGGRGHGLDFAEPSDATIPGADAALAAARSCHAPYTGAVGGAAIVGTDGRVHAAPYLENVAFNPSLSPMQGAIIRARFSECGPEDFATICVAQLEHSKIDHAEAARLVMDRLSPKARLRLVPLLAT